jgi:hypothetical protein
MKRSFKPQASSLREAGEKHQIPSSKHQRNREEAGRSTKFQAPSTRESPSLKLQTFRTMTKTVRKIFADGPGIPSRPWNLVFGVSLELGAWSLEVSRRNRANKLSLQALAIS